MKKTLLFVFLILTSDLFSQDCDFPLQYCSGTTIDLPLSTNTTAPAGPDYGCLTTSPNPTFFYFQISQPGNLLLSASGSNGNDIDFICWGPFTSPFSACSNNALNTSAIDCSYSAASTESITINNALIDQYYILCVTNYSNVPENLILSSDPSSTAATTCNDTVCNLITSGAICFVNTNDSIQNEIYFNHTATGLKGTIIYRQNAMNLWDSIGNVPSNQPDKFIDTVANPNQQSFSYCISQVDSCDNIRPKSSSHKTIFLETSVGPVPQIYLYWNAYTGVTFPTYYIFRGPTPSTMSLIDQVSSTTLAYTDLNPPAGINYYKVAFDAPNCSSNSPFDTLVNSNYVFNENGNPCGTVCDTNSITEICFVHTNDSLQNEIYFNHSATGIAGTIIYRENAMSMWDSIGYVPSNQPDKFIDTVANANQQSFTYCIAQVDSCGCYHPKSASHKTNFLVTSPGSGSQINLSWNGYLGLTFPTYYILRGTTPSTLSLIDQVSSSTFAYTDSFPPAGINYYKITFDTPNCSSNAPHDTLVSSNHNDIFGTTGIDNLSQTEYFSVYPNPTKDNLTILNYEIPKHIEISDLIGNVALIINPTGEIEKINIENFSKGIYFVRVTNSKGIFCKKVIIE